MHCQLAHDARPVGSVDPTAVRTHLQALLASTAFRSSKRLGLFLTFVVEKTLAGQSDEIKEYTIATEVYGRSEDYNSQVDSTVRVEASRLRAKLRAYYDSEGADAGLKLELPKGSYVPVFVYSSAGESNPASAVPRVTEPVQSDRKAAIWARYSRVVPASAILMVLFCVLAITVQSDRVRLLLTSQPVTITPTRFHAGSSMDDPQLLTMYLRADQLLRQPVFPKGWSGDLPPSVLESIALFEEITRRAPKDAKAWAGLAEAREWAYELDKHHPLERLEAARNAAERAVAIAPDLADAHSRLAALYLYAYGDLERAEQASIRAVMLNPHDIRSHARYADVLRMKGRLPDALAAVQRALAKNTASSRLWSQQALVLYDLNRLPEAMRAADHALELQPGNQMNETAIAHWVRGLCFQQQGMLEAAEGEFRQGLAVAPQDDRNQPALGYVLARRGRTAQAREVLAALEHQHAQGKPVRYGIALLHAALGNHAQAGQWLQQSAMAGETSYRFLPLDKRLPIAKRPSISAS